MSLVRIRLPSKSHFDGGKKAKDLAFLGFEMKTPASRRWLNRLSGRDTRLACPPERNPATVNAIDGRGSQLLGFRPRFEMRAMFLRLVKTDRVGPREAGAPNVSFGDGVTGHASRVPAEGESGRQHIPRDIFRNDDVSSFSSSKFLVSLSLKMRFEFNYMLGAHFFPLLTKHGGV